MEIRAELISSIHIYIYTIQNANVFVCYMWKGICVMGCRIRVVVCVFSFRLVVRIFVVMLHANPLLFLTLLQTMLLHSAS